MTALYASIEQIKNKIEHPAYDVWALGISLYTLMAKKEPF
jgi:serine/threonine protein kinase